MFRGLVLYSILLLSCSLPSGALGIPDLLPSYSMTHHTNNNLPSFLAPETGRHRTSYCAPRLPRP